MALGGGIKPAPLYVQIKIAFPLNWINKIYELS
jgi:hypothetical protein